MTIINYLYPYEKQRNQGRHKVGPTARANGSACLGPRLKRVGLCPTRFNVAMLPFNNITGSYALEK